MLFAKSGKFLVLLLFYFCIYFLGNFSEPKGPKDADLALCPLKCVTAASGINEKLMPIQVLHQDFKLLRLMILKLINHFQSFNTPYQSILD